MPLTLADGQLGATSGTILGAASTERTVSVLLYNTSRSSEQEVELTVLRAGSTARTIARGVLKGRESMQVLGLPLDPSSILAGIATTALAVDYTIVQGEGPYELTMRDENGVPKVSNEITITVPATIGLSDGDATIVARLDAMLGALLKIQ